MNSIIIKNKLYRLIRIKNLLIGTVIFLIIFIFFILLNIVNANKINLGTNSAGINIGGLNPEQAKKKLDTVNSEFTNRELTLKYQNSEWKSTPQKFGIEIDTAKTVQMAVSYGHGKNILANSWQQFKSLIGFNLILEWKIDEKKLEESLQTNLNSIYHPSQNATLVYDAKTRDFATVPENEGATIDKNKFKKDLEKNTIDPKHSNITLVLISNKPEITKSETSYAYEKIKTIMQSLPLPVSIITNNIGSLSENIEEIDKIDTEKLLNLISFEPITDPQNSGNKILGIKINEEKAKNYLISLVPSVNQEPIDAKLTFKNNKVEIFTLSQEGIRLEIEENIPLLFNNILNGKEINLIVTKTNPTITTASINNLGITSLLGKGSSNYSGSPVNRVHNIKIGAAKFNGVLLKPNEEFSFNTILGDVGPEQGYEPELVIKQNKTVPEYGGGLCQISTTVFRAAVYSGLKITERFPHAFPVKYYNPQGFDATIYPPSPDLKFINNTPGYILLQSKITGTELTFEVYGTEDGRRVKLEGPTVYETKDDGSMKAILIQEVYDKDGNLMFKKSFYSNYKSPNLFPVVRNPLE